MSITIDGECFTRTAMINAPHSFNVCPHMTTFVCLDENCRNKSQRLKPLWNLKASKVRFFLSHSRLVKQRCFRLVGQNGNQPKVSVSSREGETPFNCFTSWTLKFILKSFEWSGYSWYIPGVMAFRWITLHGSGKGWGDIRTKVLSANFPSEVKSHNSVKTAFFCSNATLERSYQAWSKLKQIASNNPHT